MDNIVHFLDANYVPIAQPVDIYSSLTYTSKWDEYGEFKFVSSPSLFASINLAKRVSVNGKTFMLDNIKTKDASANDEMSVSGRSLEALLDKVVNPTPIRIRGNMEVQVRAVVTSLAITGLQSVTKLALGTLHGYQNSIDTVVPRGSLGLWLYTTLNQRGFSYTINYDQATDSVLFDIVQEVDRSNDQDANEPVVFSSQKGNIENVEYSKSDTDACNFAIVYDDETGEIVYVDESNGEEKRSLIVQGHSANTASDESLYLMIGANQNTIYTSVDGIAFTLVATFSASTFISDVRYLGGYFMACGYTTGASTTAIVLSSLDGVTWSQIGSRSNCSFGRMAYDDGMMILTGRDSSDAANSLFSSYDGISFSKFYLEGNSTTEPPQHIDGTWYFGAYNTTDRNLVIYKSEHGIDWEKKTFAVSSSAYDPPVKPSVFIKIAQDILCVGSINPVGADAGDLMVARSSDEFITCEISSFNTALYSLSARGAIEDNGKIVIAREVGISYSLDGGDTFYDITSPGFPPVCTSLCGHDGVGFYIYGYNGTTLACHKAYSTNAVDWTFTAVPTLPNGSDDGSYGSSTQIMSMGDIGRAALAEARAVEVIDGDVLPNASPIIGTDCNVGDITSVVDINRGIIATKRLVAAQTVIEGNAHYTIPKFGTDYLSLTKYIKKEIAKNV